MTLYRKMEHPEGIAEALALLGKVETTQGDYARARALYDESLTLARDIGDQELIASGLTGLARVVAMQGELNWAVRLWGSAEALREAIGAPVPPIERADYDQAVAAVRDALGKSAYDAAWAQGRMMTAEQVLTVR